MDEVADGRGKRYHLPRHVNLLYEPVHHEDGHAGVENGGGKVSPGDDCHQHERGIVREPGRKSGRVPEGECDYRHLHEGRHDGPDEAEPGVLVADLEVPAQEVPELGHVGPQAEPVPSSLICTGVPRAGSSSPNSSTRGMTTLRLPAMRKAFNRPWRIYGRMLDWLT